MSPVSDVKDVYGSTPALGGEAAPNSAVALFQKDREAWIKGGFAAQRGQARSLRQ